MHVKQFASHHGLSYGCALSNPQCKTSYHAGKVTAMKRGKAQVDLHMIVERAKKNQEELKKKKQALKKKKPKIKGGVIASYGQMN
jgi:Na+-transporting NADH:ubiquinone oxidoreductase subunit NqrA